MEQVVNNGISLVDQGPDCPHDVVVDERSINIPENVIDTVPPLPFLPPSPSSARERLPGLFEGSLPVTPILFNLIFIKYHSLY
jgi:hypothetical protein